MKFSPPHSPPSNDFKNVGCVYDSYSIGCLEVLGMNRILLGLMLDVGERKKKKTRNPIYCMSHPKEARNKLKTSYAHLGVELE